MKTDKEIKSKAFTAHRPNGVYLQFPNGNALSTVWDVGTYSDNHEHGNLFNMKTFNDRIEEGSDTVEVMPHCGELVMKLLRAKFPDNDDGNIFTYLTFPQWLEMVNILNKK